YRDLIREAMYDELFRLAISEATYLSDLETAGKPANVEAVAFARVDPDSAEQIREQWEIMSSPMPTGLTPAMEQLVRKERAASTEFIEELRLRCTSRKVPVRLLFESRVPASDASSPGFLIQRLKNLGVNPAGN